MRQMLILSGKGGTGKTTIASAFIKLSAVEAYADCDVDAPNLHLVTGWESQPGRSDYFGLPKAEIDSESCDECDLCRQNCRFEAIAAKPQYQVDPFACEGCGVCEYICPTGAVSLKPAAAGDLMLYSDQKNVFSTARLRMGSGTSGKLVSEVKNQMKSAAAHAELAIIDGSPGIGCPVIASMSGVDLVLVVAEPSLSGISDMERILNTAAVFGTKTAVCINKYDINIENTKKIEQFCIDRGQPFVGRIPFDQAAVSAINNGRTIVDVNCISGTAVKAVYHKTMALLDTADASV
ncbi:MAG TPA: 4Fe-4S binding protein [Clostridiales bacterium]|jgi:MinD superfamily P-loop ATPase|nr:4Fe-4S binding protein [Clostridiales bacterium]